MKSLRSLSDQSNEFPSQKTKTLFKVAKNSKNFLNNEKSLEFKEKNNNIRVVIDLSEQLANLVRSARVQSPLWPSTFDQYVASCNVSVCSLGSSFSPPFRPLAHGDIQYL